jgi:transcriptional regulator with XRE-family HTH domain
MRSKVQEIDTEWFTARMAERRITQRGLAKLLGVDASSAHHLLHGRRVMTAAHAAQIAMILAVPLADVMRHGGIKMGKASTGDAPIAINGVRDVPIVGTVDGQGEVAIDFDHTRGHVPAVPGLPDGAVAVQYRTIMSPWQVWDGWFAFIEPPTELGDPGRHLNKLVVTKITGSVTVIRQMLPGYAPGRFNLVTVGATDFEDAEVEWATPVLMFRPR